MIEIIPNWHPLLVHFTVGLLTTSVLFYLASACLFKTNSWKQQWLTMANWSLWSGCLFAIATAIAGWLAYNSVAHDSASHAAMTLHRNWALPTASTFLILGLWAIFMARRNARPGFLFLTASIIAAGLLMVTGWLGAEGVYRYGLGVQSLPVVAEGADGHNHSHGAEHDNHKNKETLPATEQSVEQDGHQQHEPESKTVLIEQPLTDAAPEYSHEAKKTPHETEQRFTQNEHQHESNSKNTYVTTEQINNITKNNHKSITQDTIEPTVPLSAAESHNHDSNSSQANEEVVNEKNHSHNHEHNH